MSICVSCENSLVIEIAPNEDEQEVESSSFKNLSTGVQIVADDVELACGCHFHWDCLLETYELTECPYCSKNIASTSSTGEQQVLCNLNNEGGLQTDLDILPLLTEESYLKAYPTERRNRAFLELCREGDYEAIVDMLQHDEMEEDDDGDEQMLNSEKLGKRTGIDELLRYQDPIGEMQSGLHAAVQAQSREVAWLLLLLASNLDLEEFPALVFQDCASLGIMRGLTQDKVDIRSLRDANNKTAEDFASEIGGVWHGWTGNGRLTI